MASQVLVLSGGVGGAKLALGLSRIMAAQALTVVVNTGDDFDHFGLRICPDLDTTLYTLAGLANTELGWGRAAESWQCLDTITALGGEDWFRLGDKDIALHLMRSQALAAGDTLAQVTQHLCRRLHVGPAILPMTNDKVATELETSVGRLPFQEYFVKRQCQPEVRQIEFIGADKAEPLPQVLALLRSEQLQTVVIAPSNPFLSVAPMLAMPSLREALQQTSATVVAVSPVISGEAVKGPTTKIMREMKLTPSALSVAQYYDDLLDGFVMDHGDHHLLPELPVPGLCTHTLMTSLDDRDRLASDVLAFAEQIRQRS